MNISDEIYEEILEIVKITNSQDEMKNKIKKIINEVVEDEN